MSRTFSADKDVALSKSIAPFAKRASQQSRLHNGEIEFTMFESSLLARVLGTRQQSPNAERYASKESYIVENSPSVQHPLSSFGKLYPLLIRDPGVLYSPYVIA